MERGWAAVGEARGVDRAGLGVAEGGVETASAIFLAARASPQIAAVFVFQNRVAQNVCHDALRLPRTKLLRVDVAPLCKRKITAPSRTDHVSVPFAIRTPFMLP